MQLKRANPKAFDTLKLQLAALRGIEGKVGWFSSAKYPNGTPVAYAMAIQELGYPGGNIPPRPFFRPTYFREKDNWIKIAAAMAKRVLKGQGTARDIMEVVTLQAEGDVLKTIASIHSPALSPVTIEIRAMKKADPTLVVTRRTVWEAIRRVKSPDYKTPTGVSQKPLDDTGLALATLTHTVESA